MSCQFPEQSIIVSTPVPGGLHCCDLLQGMVSESGCRACLDVQAEKKAKLREREKERKKKVAERRAKQGQETRAAAEG